MQRRPSRSQANASDGQEPAQDGITSENYAAFEEVVKEFQAVLEREDQALREEFGEGFSPMQAQARALLWLMALRDVHLEAMKEAIAKSDVEAVGGWAGDMGKIAAAIAILETIQPITPQEEDSADPQQGMGKGFAAKG